MQCQTTFEVTVQKVGFISSTRPTDYLLLLTHFGYEYYQSF